MQQVVLAERPGAAVDGRHGRGPVHDERPAAAQVDHGRGRRTRLLPVLQHDDGPCGRRAGCRRPAPARWRGRWSTRVRPSARRGCAPRPPGDWLHRPGSPCRRRSRGPVSSRAGRGRPRAAPGPCGCRPAPATTGSRWAAPSGPAPEGEEVEDDGLDEDKDGLDEDEDEAWARVHPRVGAGAAGEGQGGGEQRRRGASGRREGRARIRRRCCAGSAPGWPGSSGTTAPLDPADVRLGGVEALLVPRLEVADAGGPVAVLVVAAADLEVAGGVVVEVGVVAASAGSVQDHRRAVVGDVAHQAASSSG